MEIEVYDIQYYPWPSCSKHHQLNELINYKLVNIVAKIFSNTLIFLLQKCE